MWRFQPIQKLTPTCCLEAKAETEVVAALAALVVVAALAALVVVVVVSSPRECFCSRIPSNPDILLVV